MIKIVCDSCHNPIGDGEKICCGACEETLQDQIAELEAQVATRDDIISKLEEQVSELGHS